MKRFVLPGAVCVVVVLAGVGLTRAQPRTTKLTAEDFGEIQRLLYTNHTGYDFAIRDNGDMWTGTFTPDAVLDNPPSHVVGETAIRAYATDPAQKAPNRKFRHWSSTFNVTPNAEGATLSAFYLVISDGNGQQPMTISSTGRYESLVVKTKNGWRIKHHVVFGEGSAYAHPPEAAAATARPARAPQ
jgi:SnoaL-like protein